MIVCKENMLTHISFSGIPPPWAPKAGKEAEEDEEDCDDDDDEDVVYKHVAYNGKMAGKFNGTQ